MSPVYPKNGYESQAPNPDLQRDARIARWQMDWMEDRPFDRDLVRKVMAERGVKQAELGKAVGLSQRAISELLRSEDSDKKPRKVTAEEAAEIYRFLSIEAEPRVQMVPLIGIASAGTWQEAVRLPVRHRPIPLGIAGKNAFAVEVKGDSMDLLLPEGGWAIVDPDQTDLYRGRVYLIENAEHETTIKRFQSDPARFEPVSRNHLHEVLTLAPGSFKVIGRVVSYGNDAGL